MPRTTQRVSKSPLGDLGVGTDGRNLVMSSEKNRGPDQSNKYPGEGIGAWTKDRLYLVVTNILTECLNIIHFFKFNVSVNDCNTVFYVMVRFLYFKMMRKKLEHKKEK